MKAGEAPLRRPPREARPTEHGRFFLVPPEVDVAGLDFSAPVSEPGTKALAWWRAPVIEVIAGVREGRVLRGGRVYLQTSSSWTPVQERLERTYPSLPRVHAKLARVVGRWPEADLGRFRIGPAAADQARRGAIELRDGRIVVSPVD